MPCCRSMKTVFCESILLIAMIAVVGHLSVNFWERYIIQSELSQMKQSLQFLKSTIANIGNAYDKLHTQIKGLSDTTIKKTSILNTMVAPSDFDRSSNKYTQKFNEIAVNTIYDENDEAFNTRAPVNNDFPLKDIPKEEADYSSPQANYEANYVALDANTENEANQYAKKADVNNKGNQFPFEANAENDAYQLAKNAEVNEEKVQSEFKPYAKNEVSQLAKKTDKARQHLKTIAMDDKDKQFQLTGNRKSKQNQHPQMTDAKDETNQYPHKANARDGAKDLQPKANVNDKTEPPQNPDSDNEADQFVKKVAVKNKANQFPRKANAKNGAQYLLSETQKENESGYLSLNGNADKITNQSPNKFGTKDEAKRLSVMANSKNEAKYPSLKTDSDNKDEYLLPTINGKDEDTQRLKKSGTTNEDNDAMFTASAKNDANHLSSKDSTKDEASKFSKVSLKNEYLSSKATAQNKAENLLPNINENNDVKGNPSKASGNKEVRPVKCLCGKPIGVPLTATQQDTTTMTRNPSKAAGSGRDYNCDRQTKITEENARSNSKNKLHKCYKQYTCYSSNLFNFWKI